MNINIKNTYWDSFDCEINSEELFQEWYEECCREYDALAEESFIAELIDEEDIPF